MKTRRPLQTSVACQHGALLGANVHKRLENMQCSSIFSSEVTDKARRKEWIIRIRRDEGPNFKVTNRTYVCSEHFKKEDYQVGLGGKRNLKRDAVPSVFPWNVKKPGRKPRKEIPTTSDSPSNDEDDMDVDATNDSVLISESGAGINFHDYVVTPRTSEEKLQAAEDRIQELEAKLETQQVERFGLQRFSNDNDLIRFYTGFTSYLLLKTFLDALSPHASEMIRYTQFQRRKSDKAKKMYHSFNSKLSLIDQFFMFLHKMR